MHSSSLDCEKSRDGGEVLVAIATLVTEGRIPGKLSSKTKGFYEGPHCALSKTSSSHKCDLTDVLCSNFENIRYKVLKLWKNTIPVCVEVLLTCSCEKDTSIKTSDKFKDDFLLEKWYFTINHRRSAEPLPFNFVQLINAIRSQLYFSQLTAWLTVQDEKTSFKITNQNLRYRLTLPGETYESTNFSLTAVKHDFPPTDIGNGYIANVSFESLPRMSTLPIVTCPKCSSLSKSDSSSSILYPSSSKIEKSKTTTKVVDDRMLTYCNIKGKHHCEELEDIENGIKSNKSSNFKKFCHYRQDCLNCNNKPSTSSYKSVMNFGTIPSNKWFQTIRFNNNNSSSSSSNNSGSSSGSGGSSSSSSSNCISNSSNSSISRHQNLLNSHKINDLKIVEDKGKLLLDAIERSGQKSTKEKCRCNNMRESDRSCDEICVQQMNDSSASKIDDNGICDMSASDIPSIKGKKSKFNVFVDNHCDSPIPKLKEKEIIDKLTNLNLIKRPKTKLHIPKNKNIINNNGNDDDDDDDNLEKFNNLCDKTIDNFNKIEQKNNCIIDIPSASEQAKFRKELDNAASMVFHSRTGLPLTSSPAPVRRGKSCFDFDSSINSVSAIKSALFPTSVEDESESDGSIVSPCSPETYKTLKRPTPPVKYRKGDAANLLGNFEESVLNGRLEPDSTVHGFTAKVGASGSFVPNQLAVPVTVFFYALIDNDKISSPYLGHINLGKKGYNVPKQGTVQVTLLNPHGTVVKMFVIMYNLNDMPPYSTTFVRQRVVHIPASLAKDTDEKEWMEVKWLRYLIHLRFVSSKSGKIYLHKDIRIIVYRKTDMDTAVGYNETDAGYELRSFNQMPSNPKFSPRK